MEQNVDDMVSTEQPWTLAGFAQPFFMTMESVGSKRGKGS
jgi:hypothetical protein